MKKKDETGSKWWQLKNKPVLPKPAKSGVPESASAVLPSPAPPPVAVNFGNPSHAPPVEPPPRVIPTEPPPDAALHPMAAPHHAWLGQHGELCVRSGIVASADANIFFHSDYGPLWQEKSTNQDYALVWKGERNGVPVLALAIGDGVTSSYGSELASQAACSAALHTLVAELDPQAPRAAFEAAAAAALQATKVLACELTLNPEKSCPPGQYPATWKYILRQGLFLQTTLTLAWLAEDRLCAAGVGDGGCLVHAANLAGLQIVAQPDLATQEVNAIGPGDAGPIPLDYYFEERLERPFVAVFYTDGVGRGVGAEPVRLIEALDAPALLKVPNPAHTFITDAIASAIQHQSHEFDDNLTLAILRSTAIPQS